MSQNQDVYIPIHNADPNKRVSIDYNSLMTRNFMETIFFFFVQRYNVH